MQFKVIKSSPDGMTNGCPTYSAVDEVLREISHYKGWESREALHAAIRKWAEKAKPGDVFCTAASAVVAVSQSGLVADEYLCPFCGDTDGLEYADLVAEAEEVKQYIRCPDCDTEWVDVFTLTERRGIRTPAN